MQDRSVFGEIVTRLASSAEDIATEALCYVLRTYPSAWASLHRLLEKSCDGFDEHLTFSTQASTDDEGRPDLVGTDQDGDRIFVLEAKFWAGLTPNQPVSYLKLLPQGKTSMVLVVAPGLRLDMLWNKLRDVTETAGIICQETVNVSHEFRVCRLTDSHQLGLISWRAILGEIERDADVAGLANLKGDVAQLSGLCSKMDGESFLPLTNGDLSPDVGRRIRQFVDLVDSSLDVLNARYGDCVRRISSGGARGSYVRFFTMHGYGLALCFEPEKWASCSETPLWVSVKLADRRHDWPPSSRITEALQRVFAGSTRDVLVDNSTVPWVPIHLPTGCERSEVLESIVDQVNEIAQAARTSGEVPIQIQS